MADSTKAIPGTIGWIDLTAPDAEQVRTFYEGIAGWQPAPVDMGGYSDYTMSPPGGGPVAGICHKQGANAALPSQWMIYINVPDLKASLARCRELGGQVLIEPAATGHASRYAVIEDPAGAVCALYQPE
jgi:predicted enzyme related to lactoylglutathione lyase